MLYQIVDPDTLLFMGRLNFSFGIVLSPSLFIFVRNFPKAKSTSGLEVFIWLEMSIILLLNQFSAFVVVEETLIDGNLKTIYGPGYGLFIFHFLTYLLIALYRLVDGYRNSKGKEKFQRKLLFLGLSVSVFWGVITNIVNPILFTAGLYSIEAYTLIQNLGMFSVLIFAFTIFFAIFRYQFLDIRLIIGRIIYYLVTASVAFFVFYAVLIFDQTVFGDFFSAGSILFGTFVAVVFVIAYNSLNTYIREQVDSRIIFPNYDPNAEIARFNQAISTTLDYNLVSEKTSELISKTVRPSFSYVLVQDSKGNPKIFQKNGYSSDQMDKLKKLLEMLHPLDIKIFNLDQLENEIPPEFKTLDYIVKEVIVIMQELGIKVIVPFKQESNDIFGAILVGSKAGNSYYSGSEVTFIKSLADITAVSLARAFLYEEVQEFNATLQAKVDEATKELKVANDQLAEQLRKERDMMDILGHELRTPLGTARNAIVMMSDLSEKNSLDPEKQAKYLKMAKDNIRREKDLLETILQSARLENDRVQINLERVKIQDMIDDSLEAFGPMAEKKKLELKTEISIDANTEVAADKTAIQQVLDNLVSNAVKYTPSGSVLIKVTEEENKVRFSVIDTGEGISPENIANLGKKFYRINPHLNSDGKIGGRKIVRPGGTGIGLYVIKGLLQAMDSKLEVTSEGVGKGSTFSFVIAKAGDTLGQEGQNQNPDIFDSTPIEKTEQPNKEISTGQPALAQAENLNTNDPGHQETIANQQKQTFFTNLSNLNESTTNSNQPNSTP